MSGSGVTPSDILAALIRLTGERLLISDPHRFHGAVRMAQPICPLLEVFPFSPTSPHATSRALDEALGLLKLARVIRMENTDYERYIIDADAGDYIEREILPRFSSEERQELEQAAAILREACGITEAAEAALAI